MSLIQDHYQSYWYSIDMRERAEVMIKKVCREKVACGSYREAITLPLFTVYRRPEC